MAKFSVAEAKNTLPRLIDKALAGEEVVITRHGKPVVELRAAAPAPHRAPEKVDKWLRMRTKARKSVGITSVELLNSLYEDDDV